MRKLLVLTTIISWNFFGQCQGSGLPCSSQHTMKPSYGKPQSIEDNPPPYKLFVLDSRGQIVKYYKNEIYTIVLNTTGYFRAFLLQGRLSTRQGYVIGHLRAGEFLEDENLWNDIGVQIQKCSPNFNNSITNSNNEKKYSIDVKWTPRRNDGAVQFVVTIIEDHETYWVQWSPESGLIFPDNDAKFTEQISIPLKNGLEPEITKIGETKLILSAGTANLSSSSNVHKENEVGKESDYKNELSGFIPDTKLLKFPSLKPIIHNYETTLEPEPTFITTAEAEIELEIETIKAKKTHTTKITDESPETSTQDVSPSYQPETITMLSEDDTERAKTEGIEEVVSTTSGKKLKLFSDKTVKHSIENSVSENADFSTLSQPETTKRLYERTKTNSVEEVLSTTSGKKLKLASDKAITDDKVSENAEFSTLSEHETTKNLPEDGSENLSTTSGKQSKLISVKPAKHLIDDNVSENLDLSTTYETPKPSIGIKTKPISEKFKILSKEKLIHLRPDDNDDLSTTFETVTDKTSTSKQLPHDDDLTTSLETELPLTTKKPTTKRQLTEEEIAKNADNERLLLSGQFGIDEALSVSPPEQVESTTLKTILKPNLRTFAIAIDDESRSETIEMLNQEAILSTDANVIETEGTTEQKVVSTTTQQTETDKLTIDSDTVISTTEHAIVINKKLIETDNVLDTSSIISSTASDVEKFGQKNRITLSTINSIVETESESNTIEIDSTKRIAATAIVVQVLDNAGTSPTATDVPFVETQSVASGLAIETILPTSGTSLKPDTLGTSSAGTSQPTPVTSPSAVGTALLPPAVVSTISPNINPATTKLQLAGSFNVTDVYADAVSTGSPKPNNDDSCASLPCYNNGTCKNTDGEGKFICNCTKDWMGKQCLERNFCSSDPCLHAGICSKVESGYSCECQTDWAGDNCELPCPVAFCQNSGSCVIDKKFGEFKCLCKKGWTGFKCETEINECLSEPCLNGATCTDRLGTYQCTCAPGFMGDRCHRPCQDIYQSCESWKDEDKCEQLRPTTKFFDTNCAKTCERCVYDNATVHTIMALPPVLEPFDFLIGTWFVNQTTGKRFPLDFPNAPYGYYEEVKFFIANISMFGTPYINYTTIATNNANEKDVQNNLGFMTLRPLPEPVRVAIMSTGNDGVTVIEEGLLLKEKEMNFKSEYFAVFPPIKAPKSTSRKFSMSGDFLVESVERTTAEGITESFIKYYFKKEKTFIY